MFLLQCTKQEWVQAWSMHCFSFSITLEWAGDTKGYAGEGWQGRNLCRASGILSVWVCMICVHVIQRKSKFIKCIVSLWLNLIFFLMLENNNFTSIFLFISSLSWIVPTVFPTWYNFQSSSKTPSLILIIHTFIYLSSSLKRTLKEDVSLKCQPQQQVHKASYQTWTSVIKQCRIMGGNNLA